MSSNRTPLKVKLYRSNLDIVESGAAASVQEAAEAGGGVLRCFPSFVGRKFCLPGKNLELHDDDYFPEGSHGWAIDERWNGSASWPTPATAFTAKVSAISTTRMAI